MNIYIVNFAVGGRCTEACNSYYHTEEDARRAYDVCLGAVGIDAAVIEIIYLDTTTLAVTTLDVFEGNMDDLHDADDADDEDSFPDEDAC